MATEKFKEIQNAYAVLSDKHERSWYDQHRESILRGGRGVGGGGGDDSDEEEGGIDLWPLFSSAAFEGFGDGKGGFYAVYAEAFRTLDQEEAAVRESAGDYSTRPAAPGFGEALTLTLTLTLTVTLTVTPTLTLTSAARVGRPSRAPGAAAAPRLRPHVPLRQYRAARPLLPRALARGARRRRARARAGAGDIGEI